MYVPDGSADIFVSAAANFQARRWFERIVAESVDGQESFGPGIGDIEATCCTYGDQEL
jgi:hypothetical protein